MENSFYKREDHQNLIWLLESEEFTSALVYLVCRRTHSLLKVTANPNSIEIWNEEVTVVIILSTAFEKKNYDSIKNIPNLHIITFLPFFNSEFNFDIDDIYIKTINTKEWFDQVLKNSKNEEIKRMCQLSRLRLKN